MKTELKESDIDEFKDVLNTSFYNELILRCDWKYRKELEILNYLKEQLELSEHFFKDEIFYNHSLYSLALEVEEYNNNNMEHNPFKDNPLCDLLNGIYLDYSELCAEYGENLVDREKIDLSDLDSLKELLVQNLISIILMDYKNDVDYLLKENNSDYLKVVELVESLEREDLSTHIKFIYSINSNYIVDLKTLKENIDKGYYIKHG